MMMIPIMINDNNKDTKIYPRYGLLGKGYMLYKLMRI